MKINDITLTDRLRKINKTRMDYFIPNYLVRHIRPTDRICSVGCGTGYDVEILNRLGYDAYGLDPGARSLDWKMRPEAVQKKLKMGYASESLFGDLKFDFIYSLEVIEHVGCIDGGWKLMDNHDNIRKDFVLSCLNLLKPGGRLLVTSSNKLCPYDPGHGHHYSRLSDFMCKRGIRLALPWHELNFLVSLRDISRWVDSAVDGEYRVKQISTTGYPSNSDGANGTVKIMFLRLIMRIFSMKLLMKFNPIFVVEITKLK